MENKHHTLSVFGGERVPIHESIPIETPLTMYLMPSARCNFKCNYCVHHNGAPNLLKEYGKDMTIDIAKKIAEQCKSFPQKMKKITLAGLGEPLMNHEISDIVKILKNADISNSVTIVTNALLLNENVSNRLIEANLDLLRVSIQGLNDETYKEITTCNVKLSEILKNIKYYYQNKKTEMNLYIKIIDSALGTHTADEFHKIFEDICDMKSIEHLNPFYSHLKTNSKKEIGIFGQPVIDNVSICSQPFTGCMIYPNGDVGSCCAEKTEIFGSILDTDIYSIWNGEKRKDFLLKQLNGRSNIEICKNCTIPEYTTPIEELLDPYKEQILKQMQSKKER